MSARRLIASVCAVFAAALLGPAGAVGLPPEPASPGTASGSFSVDGKKIELHYAYAMAQVNPFDEKKTDTAILLTDKPLPEAAFAGVKDLEAAGRLEPHNSVLFVLDESGQATREVVHHDALGDMSLQMSGMTHAAITITSRAEDRIEGSAQTKGPEDFLKHKYEVKAQFQAPIRQAHRDAAPPDAKTGKKLPPGGGEPGKAYLALQDAIRKKDLAAIRKGAKPADMPDMSDEDLRKGLEIMAAMTPVRITIDDGYVAGDAAVLYVSGILEGEKQYGTVKLSRVGGAWRPAGDSWSNKPPSR
jgi:hypothetical protein